MLTRAFRFQNIGLVSAVLAFALLPGCKVPDDPEGTTEAVTGSVLKVGALTEILDQVDANAISQIAKALQTEPELVTADPHTLFAQLTEGKIHILAGRIPANTPFTADAALSVPIGRVALGDDVEDQVLAVRKGENKFLITVNRAIEKMAE